MSKGELVELESPYTLLQSNTRFRKMVEDTGPSASQKLFQMALEAHVAKESIHWTLLSDKLGNTSYKYMQLALHSDLPIQE